MSLLALGLAAAAAATNPDVILTNGHILTEASRHSVGEVVAISKGRLVALGTNAKIRPLAGKATQVIDLHGQTATPGLIDAHAHLASGGVDHLRSIDLGNVSSMAEVRKKVAE